MRRFTFSVLLASLALIPAVHTQDMLITISDVRVGIYYSYNPAIFTAKTVNWKLPVTLAPGERLILAQNCGGYCFDTSDAGCKGYPLDMRLCDAGWALVSVMINNRLLNFWDNERILTLKGRDPLDPANEAQELRVAIVGQGFKIRLGYGDTIHQDECGSYPNSIGLFGASRCLPEGFDTPKYFQGLGVNLQVGLEQTRPWHCVRDNPYHPCWDTGIVEFEATGLTARGGL